MNKTIISLSVLLFISISAYSQSVNVQYRYQYGFQELHIKTALITVSSGFMKSSFQMALRYDNEDGLESCSLCLSLVNFSEINVIPLAGRLLIRVGDEVMTLHDSGEESYVEYDSREPEQLYVPRNGKGDVLLEKQSYYHLAVYPITKEQIDTLINHPVSKIRIERETEPLDLEFTSSKTKEFPNALRKAYNDLLITIYPSMGL